MNVCQSEHFVWSVLFSQLLVENCRKLILHSLFSHRFFLVHLPMAPSCQVLYVMFCSQLCIEGHWAIACFYLVDGLEAHWWSNVSYSWKRRPGYGKWRNVAFILLGHNVARCQPKQATRSVTRNQRGCDQLSLPISEYFHQSTTVQGIASSYTEVRFESTTCKSWLVAKWSLYHN